MRYIQGKREGDFARDLTDEHGEAWKIVIRGVAIAIVFDAGEAYDRLARPTDYDLAMVSRDYRRAWLRDLASVNTTASNAYANEFGHLGR